MQEKDKPLLEKVKNTLQCGAVYVQKERRLNHCQCYRYTVNSHRDILEIVIPFFNQYPLQSVSKKRSFTFFYKIAHLVESGSHLQKSGILKIRALKSQMNQRTTGLA